MADKNLTPYVFAAEDKHAEYGLRPDAHYRALQDRRGRTVGKPLLIHDPAYGPERPTLHNLVPFRYPEKFVVLDDRTGETHEIANPALKAMALIDTGLALTVMAIAGALIVALA